MPAKFEKHQIIDRLHAEMTHLTGRRYQIDLEKLDIASLRALQRLFQDLDTEHQQALDRARMLPWRQG